MDFANVDPVLRETYRLLNEDAETSQEAVCAALGHPPEHEPTVRALALLYEAGYIDGVTVNESPAPIFIRATEKGLKRVASWPSEGSGAELVELLLRLLDERIESAETPEEEKGRLRRARDAFAGLGRDVAVGVLAAYASQATGVSGG